MNKLFTTLFALAVASVTGLVHAQASGAAAPSAPPAAAKVAKTATPASPKSLEAKIAMCLGCHGIKGYHSSFPEVYRVPMISGQSAGYIVSALTQYKNGDRKHPTMRGIAASLSEQDIKDIANFYSNQAVPGPDKLSHEPEGHVAQLFSKGNCVSCHGPNLSKPIDPSYPKIAGQQPDYIFVALKEYKTENNPNVGRNNGVMGAIAKQFSNAELKELANYVGSLDGQLTVHPESRFR
ncbi:MAG TPA: c-type cytochrome [Ramlibacter sp.]|uniref:c-type cytochrome n=1 Tax=Ramlibacter sp. TaxID=1917967 RepID=UPI002CB9FA4A|nr:c-type cytochrome [Ramlibacter sp.]HVZ44525.1 c-type cytochrome [Ramlibacter sp.]